MNPSRIQIAKLALILLPLLLTFGTKSAIAQITPAKDGTGTVVQTQNNQLNISGGTQAGNNQFHSFQQFGVNAGQTANFIANPNIANILGRVTGGDASLINGILKVSGSNANLYLMNPSGIIFGKDASLNLPAAFTATTANGIGFGNGNWFNAVGSNNYAVLTANPTSFGFSGLSGSIVNAGNLSVNPGQSIALVGGTVVNTGTIAAPGGDITIAAIPGGKMVRIAQAGTVLSLDLPVSDKALINAPITTPLSLPALLTGGSISSAMGVVVEDGVIKLTGGSASVTGTLNADGTGSQNGGNVIAYADNHLNFGGTIAAKGGELGGNGGFVDTSGKGSIAIAPNAKVLTTAAKGLMGTWLIDPAALEVVTGTGGTIGGTGSTIGADTIVAALNGTNINLQADNSITVNAGINASLNANGGNLTLTAPTANLNQAIALKTGSTLSGTATTVNVGSTGTVQNGVDVSAANGTVNLATATYRLAQEVGINKNVTVRGTGAGTTTVSGNNAVRVFNIASGTVTLDGISIVNGRPTIGGGGGIINSGITTIQNSIIENNTASSIGSDGGGIYNFNQLTIDNTTLRNNTSSDDGGAISNNSILTITNSTLSGNRAQSGSSNFSGGGAILNTIPATATISNSTISGNTAKVGGGIRNDGTLTLTNSTVTANTATVGGGGVVNTVYPLDSTKFGKTTLQNTIIAGNTDTSTNLMTNAPDVAAFSVNSFTDQGYNLIGIGKNFNSLFDPTTLKGTAATPIDPLLAPLGNNGGAAQTHALRLGSVALNAGNPTSTVTTDQRGGQRGPAGLNAGSRIDIGAYEATSSALVTTTLDTNATGTLRNAIVFANGNTNPLAPTAPTDIRFNINALSSAQTIALTSALPRIVKSTTIDGWTQGATGYKGVPLITVSGENKVRVFEIGSGTTVGMNGLSIVNGKTIGSGGGIYSNGTLTVSNSTLSGNSATDGGGIYNDNGTLTVSNTTLSGNSAINGGGSIYNSGTLTVNNSTLSGNSAIDGGGIYNNSGTLTVSNSTLSGNSAKNGGGGIYNNNYNGTNNSGTLTVSNSILLGNSAIDGGGIFNNSGTVTVSNSTLSSNSANGGGGIYNNSDTNNSDTNNSDTNNSDTNNSDTNNSGTLTVSNSTLSGNSAIDGGGIFNNSGTLTVSNSTLSSNSAKNGGGGIYNNLGELTIGMVTVSNSTLSGNSANGGGGGIYNLGELTIDNSIVSGNTASTGRELLGSVDSTFTSQGYNLFGYNGDNGFSDVTAAATDITPTSALSKILAPLGDYGGPTKTHALLPGSVAINAGNPSVTTADQRGVLPVGTRDIGAYESKGFALLASSTSTPQSTTVNTTFNNPLQINVVETAFNRPIPVSGIVVQLTPPGIGASATLTNPIATTDAKGQVSILATANTKAGTYAVKANSTTLASTTDITLTNIADAPAKIISTNANQTAIVGNPFSTALQVQILDQYNNPVANNAVTLTLPSNGASGFFTGGGNTIVLTTDANGLVTTPLTANSTPGTYTGTIQVQGSLQTTSFSFTNDPALVTPKAQPKTDRTNLEAKEIRNPRPSIARPESILCVQRSDGRTTSSQDPYQGVENCKAITTQRKAIESQTRTDR